MRAPLWTVTRSPSVVPGYSVTWGKSRTSEPSFTPAPTTLCDPIQRAIADLGALADHRVRVDRRAGVDPDARAR